MDISATIINNKRFYKPYGEGKTYGLRK